MDKKLKVVWICAFSDMKTRQHYKTECGFLMRTIYKQTKDKSANTQDVAIWNSNGIAEMEKRDDVELYVISPIRYLSEKETRFDINGVHYYFFREENSSFFRQSVYQIFKKYCTIFKKNRHHISKLIDEIQPDIVHVIGAENPYYSMAILDVPENIPTIIQLQALLHKAQYETTVKEEKKSFHYKGEIEKQIFKRATYIGTKASVFIDYIRQNINPNARFVDTTLALTEPIDTSESDKQFDFVYFAVGIQKAVDWAIEAFAIARKEEPSLSLDVVGGYTKELKTGIDARLNELGILNAVTFEGKLATHEDVIRQIRKSKYALLPLKMDLVPGTVREAMANGLPVVTTYTEGGTPKLNETDECVLISPQGDFHAMADNMIRLVRDKELYDKLRGNALKQAAERQSNCDIISHWVDTYYKCIEEQSVVKATAKNSQ